MRLFMLMLAVFFFFFAASSCLAALALAFAPVCALIVFLILGFLCYCQYCSLAEPRPGTEEKPETHDQN